MFSIPLRNDRDDKISCDVFFFLFFFFVFFSQKNNNKKCIDIPFHIVNFPSEHHMNMVMADTMISPPLSLRRKKEETENVILSAHSKLEALITTAADKKDLPFMLIVCLADNSQEMSSPIFSEKTTN